METDSGLEDEVATSNDVATEPEPLEDEVDPAAQLAARFDEIEATVSALKGLDLNAVRSALGRIPSLQSALDDLSKRNPLAEIDPRVSASESALVAVAETLLTDPGISDASRSALVTAVRGVEQARTKREQDAREAELERRLRSELAPRPAEQAEPTNAELDAANTALVARAQAMGINPASVPWDALMAQANGVLAVASALAIDWMYEHREDAPAARVSARREAAGRGSPQRESAARTIEQDLERLMNGEIPVSDVDTRKRLSEHLGVPI